MILLPADFGGCGLHRIINPGRSILRTDPSRMDIGIGDGVRAHIGVNGTVNGVPTVDADVVVMQRVMDKRMMQAIPFIQRQGVAVVVELDDDIERVDHANSAHRYVDPKFSQQNWGILHQACQLADLVTVSTPKLARYAPHGRVAVLPNYVPEFLLRPERTQVDDVHQVRLGWSGTMETHPRDPAVTRGQIGRVVQDTGCQFWQVGMPDGVHAGFRIPKLTKVHTTGWVPLPEYPQALATLDVGVVPLDDTAFNEAKSALKGLEMAAVGIPFVASGTADYRRIAALGIGILADKPKEWYRETRRLVMDHAYRQEQSERMRIAVGETQTIEGNAYRWADAWEQAIANRKVASLRETVHATG